MYHQLVFRSRQNVFLGRTVRLLCKDAGNKARVTVATAFLACFCAIKNWKISHLHATNAMKHDGQNCEFVLSSPSRCTGMYVVINRINVSNEWSVHIPKIIKVYALIKLPEWFDSANQRCKEVWIARQKNQKTADHSSSSVLVVSWSCRNKINSIYFVSAKYLSSFDLSTTSVARVQPFKMHWIVVKRTVRRTFGRSLQHRTLCLFSNKLYYRKNYYFLRES